MPVSIVEEQPFDVDPSSWDDLIAPIEEGVPLISAIQYRVPPVDWLDDGVSSVTLTAKPTDVRPTLATLMELTTGVTIVTADDTVGAVVGGTEGVLIVVTEKPPVVRNALVTSFTSDKEDFMVVRKDPSVIDAFNWAMRVA